MLVKNYANVIVTENMLKDREEYLKKQLQDIVNGNNTKCSSCLDGHSLQDRKQ